MLFFLVINYIAHDILFSTVVKLFVYQLFGWFVICYVVTELLRIRINSFVEVISLSYLFGGISSFIFYLICMPIGLGFLLPYITILIAIVSCFYIYKKRARIKTYNIDLFGAIVCFCFLFTYFFLATFVNSFVNSMPNETTNGTGYYVDLLFWLEIILHLLKVFQVIISGK